MTSSEKRLSVVESTTAADVNKNRIHAVLTYSVDEVAVLLGIARGVAYESVRNGDIPATRLGRRWIVPRKRFHAWLDGQEAA